MSFKLYLEARCHRRIYGDRKKISVSRQTFAQYRVRQRLFEDTLRPYLCGVRQLDLSGLEFCLYALLGTRRARILHRTFIPVVKPQNNVWKNRQRFLINVELKTPSSVTKSAWNPCLLYCLQIAFLATEKVYSNNLFICKTICLTILWKGKFPQAYIVALTVLSVAQGEFWEIHRWSKVPEYKYLCP